LDTPAALAKAADSLETAARSLMKLANGALRGHPVARSTRDVARSVAYWAVAIRRVVHSGPKGWESVDALFASGTEKPPDTASEDSSGIPMEMEAELDLIVAYIVGDQVLDLLAYAELLRRDRVPAWRPGIDRVPAMWPAFMAVLDEEGPDPMRSAARYLDVTLAVARDVLVVHRDPAAVELPSYTSFGSVSLHRPVLDEERRNQADSLVYDINRSLDQPWPDNWSRDQLLDTILEVPQQLEPAVRRDIRRVYRLAGFESPQLVAILRRATRLVDAYRAAVAPEPLLGE
jgi:hypothetical protein